MGKSKGISVIVKNENDFNRIVKYLGEQALYLKWHENMLIEETAIVINAKNKTGLSSGSVGSSEYQNNLGLNVVTIDNFFTI